VPAKDIEASVRYYTEQLDGELVWKIHAFGAWVAAIRLSPTGPMSCWPIIFTATHPF
jgi:hypothetical protein